MDKSMRLLHCEAGAWDFHLSRVTECKSMEHQDRSVDTMGKGFFMGGHEEVCI